MAIPPEDSFPEAVLDAGGETVDVLEEALGRCAHDLSPTGILYVISLWPGSRQIIPAWCRAREMTLLDVREEGEETRFWLRKSPTIGPP